MMITVVISVSTQMAPTFVNVTVAFKFQLMERPVKVRCLNILMLQIYIENKEVNCLCTVNAVTRK